MKSNAFYNMVFYNAGTQVEDFYYLNKHFKSAALLKENFICFCQKDNKISCVS